jgi:hypothetical protein
MFTYLKEKMYLSSSLLPRVAWASFLNQVLLPACFTWLDVLVTEWAPIGCLRRLCNLALLIGCVLIILSLMDALLASIALLELA